MPHRSLSPEAENPRENLPTGKGKYGRLAAVTRHYEICLGSVTIRIQDDATGDSRKDPRAKYGSEGWGFEFLRVHRKFPGQIVASINPATPDRQKLSSNAGQSPNGF
jgi:hypothetical protein